MAQRNQYSPDSYRKWRERLPYTDAQIIAAIDRWYESQSRCASESSRAYFGKRAGSMRSAVTRGFLSISIYSAVLPYLVEACALCGRKAHYRYGDEGRCRLHRDVKPGWFAAHAARKDARNASVSMSQNDRDRRTKTSERLRELASRAKGRSKA